MGAQAVLTMFQYLVLPHVLWLTTQQTFCQLNTGLLCQIHLDFAKMKRDNPSLITLKDFLMSSNQAPETESDIQHLLQAFAEYKQG